MLHHSIPFHISCTEIDLNMNTSEKLCLKWNDFQENISSYFGDLRNSKDFTDVTLACDDGEQLEAHKVILASSSPIFLEILTSQTHSHPLVFMRGVRSEDLVAILDFLYFGEANVLRDNLESFLAAAEDLKLKGLCGGGQLEEKETDKKPPIESVVAPIKKKKRRNRANSKIQDSKGSISLNKPRMNVEFKDLDEQIKSMMTKSNISSGIGQGSLATCNICGKESPAKSMPRHIEATHITISHASDICEKVSKSRNALKKHKGDNHRSTEKSI